MRKRLSFTLACFCVIAFFSVLEAQDTQPINTIITNSQCVDNMNCTNCNLKVYGSPPWCIAMKCNTDLPQAFQTCVPFTQNDGSQKCKFTGQYNTACNNNCTYWQCAQLDMGGNCTIDVSTNACNCTGQGGAPLPGDRTATPICTTG
jgi:hypothetical protein